MKIPIGITTHQRPEYLERTLESFFHLNYNHLDSFTFLIYVQGADCDTKSIIKTHSNRFDLIEMTEENLGCAHGYSFIMNECLRLNSDLVMYLQDDWLSTEPVGNYLTEIKALFDGYPDVGYIRLRTNQNRVGRIHPVTNKRFKPKNLNGERYCHVLLTENMFFTLNPTIARSELVRKILPITEEMDAMLKVHDLAVGGSQLKANCFTHIGVKRATSVNKSGGLVWIK